MASHLARQGSSAPAPQPARSLCATLLYLWGFLSSITIMLFAATVIHRYGSQKDAIEDLEKTIFSRKLPIPTFLDNRESPLVLLCCVMFMYALVLNIRMHNTDDHQTLFIFGAFFLAQIADAIYTGLYTAGGVYLFLLKSFIPVMLVMAVVMSALFHALLRVCAGSTTIKDDQAVEYRDEKAGDIEKN